MKRLVPLTLTAVLLAGSGCHLFSKKKPDPNAVPKEGPNVAGDVEKDFMHRWIEKRTADLVAAGSSPTAARAQAEAEFTAKYNYTDAARQQK
jgi:hypothetical protein